jgi:hypothetical protein
MHSDFSSTSPYRGAALRMTPAGLHQSGGYLPMARYLAEGPEGQYAFF